MRRFYLLILLLGVIASCDAATITLSTSAGPGLSLNSIASIQLYVMILDPHSVASAEITQSITTTEQTCNPRFGSCPGFINDRTTLNGASLGINGPYDAGVGIEGSDVFCNGARGISQCRVLFFSSGIYTLSVELHEPGRFFTDRNSAALQRDLHRDRDGWQQRHHSSYSRAVALCPSAVGLWGRVPVTETT